MIYAAAEIERAAKRKAATVGRKTYMETRADAVHIEVQPMQLSNFPKKLVDFDGPDIVRPEIQER